jgi:hypothetical protein
MRYGVYYWCVVTDAFDETKELYVWADELRVEDGALVFYSHGRTDDTDRERKPLYVTYALGRGQWRVVYAVSPSDERAVAEDRRE